MYRGIPWRTCGNQGWDGEIIYSSYDVPAETAPDDHGITGTEKEKYFRYFKEERLYHLKKYQTPNVRGLWHSVFSIFWNLISGWLAGAGNNWYGKFFWTYYWCFSFNVIISSSKYSYKNLVKI